MAYKKQLHDKDGNVIYPDVGINLEDVVYSDDPTEPVDEIIDPEGYYTSETKTGGTWIDGKPIYKKTINFGTLPNNTSKSLSHSISNLDYLVRIEGVAYNSGRNFRPLPMVGLTLGDMVRIDATSTSVSARTTTDWSGYSAYITMYYTKTTD